MQSLRGATRTYWAIALLLCVIASPASAAVQLALREERQAATDLEVSGLLRGVPHGERRWLRWDDIRQLPSRTIHTDGEFLAGPQALRIVALDELLARLPLAAGVDTVIAECVDGYAATYSAEFRAQWKPFIVVEINGVGPAQWPLPGMPTDPGPYILSVSDAVVPGVGQLLDVAHKQPWGTNVLRFVRAADEFRSLYEPRWQTPSAAAERGRELWINSCFSCHKGPDERTGGTRSGRPFAVLHALARHAPGYFSAYVRNPQALVPTARMTAHDHYTSEQLADLIEFIGGSPPRLD